MGKKVRDYPEAREWVDGYFVHFLFIGRETPRYYAEGPHIKDDSPEWEAWNTQGVVPPTWHVWIQSRSSKDRKRFAWVYEVAKQKRAR